MKFIFTLTILTSLLSVPAFASVGQSDTECPMMRESNTRGNSKSNLSSQQKTRSNKKNKVRSV